MVPGGLCDMLSIHSWPLALERIRTQPKEATHDSHDGAPVFFHALRSDAPFEVVQALLRAHAEAQWECHGHLLDYSRVHPIGDVRNPWFVGTTAVHEAARCCRDPAVLLLLLKSYPAASTKLDCMGRIPLYYVSSYDKDLFYFGHPRWTEENKFLKACLLAKAMFRGIVPQDISTDNLPNLVLHDLVACYRRMGNDMIKLIQYGVNEHSSYNKWMTMATEPSILRV